MRTLAAWSLSLVLLAPIAPAAATARYYIAFLRPAPDRTPLAPADAERIQAAHMANIEDMGKRGIVVAAGPFEDKPPTISGIFVFALKSREEAQRIAESDPTVVAHRNVIDVVTWDGPAGIGAEYVRLHAGHPEMPEGMGVQPFFMLYAADTSASVHVTDPETTYLNGLRAAGHVAAWGSASGRPGLVAIVVFNRLTDDEAQRLMAADPAVASGSTRAEFHRWWCAAHVLPG
jgi:uncharacterized protein YciI